MSEAPQTLGSYDLLARIARGGMAEIFLARKQGVSGPSRLVVVKRILPYLAEESHFVEMFLEEARLAKQIDHPNVVQIFDVGQHDGNYYMAMEYVPGVSVGLIARRARERRQPLPFEIACEIAAQACGGLHAAHELRDENDRLLHLVHRDVSPHNLMIGEDGAVKLLDFGIAKARDTTVRTTTGSIKGKFPYMSPEQCRGDPLDRRTDVFSLGIVLFELLSGQRLFERPTELMILKAITEEPLPRLRELNRGVPTEIEQIVLRALHRDRDQRYPTAAAFGAELRGRLAAVGGDASPELLARYLEQMWGDYLQKRSEKVQRAVKERRPSQSIPMIALESGGSRSNRAELRSGATQPVRAVRRSKKLIWAAVAAVVFGVAAGLGYRYLMAPARPIGPPLRFGMVPAIPAATVHRQLAPFTRYLERELDRRVEVVVPPNYETLRRDLLRGKLQVATLPPLQFVIARAEDPRLEALVAPTYEGARNYQGYLVVRADGPIRSVADLRATRMCYVERGSTSGYLLPRVFLRSQELDPDKLFSESRFSGSHTKVMRDLLAGRCDVGAIYSGAHLNADEMGIPRYKIRVLAVTGVIPLDVICTFPRLVPQLRAKLKRTLLALDPNKEMGRPTLSELYPINSYVEPDNTAFREIARAARHEGLLKPTR